jgi:L-cysteine:1D-myo-inositol 2-amino-2-deoxy-alpha-D-glucopyranoside ligase
MVKTLIEKNHAYEVDGTVFFHVPSFKEYGELSHYQRSEMIALSRERGADPDDKRKKDQLDFILWQRSLPGEPKWDSPWGQGRPGWHIECSSMIKKTLGDQIDIHGGGFDLIYPHHESERAQSESATGKKPFVRYWTHTAMVEYESEKMSKSLGNLVHVSDLLKTYSSDSIRYVLLSHHYRTPWEFQFGELDEAEKEIGLIKKAYTVLLKEKDITKTTEMFEGISLLDDDMQTPDALMRLCELAKNIRSGTLAGTSDIQEFRDLVGILGFSFAGNPFN